MRTYLPRKALLERLKTLLNHYPTVAILGSRQVGKSTLARKVLTQQNSSVYLDLELPSQLRKLSDPEAFFELHHKSLICLDEVQYKPEVFQVLRGVIDGRQRMGQFLVLGSVFERFDSPEQ